MRLSVLLFYIFCSIYTHAHVKIRADIANPYGGEASDFFSAVNYIPLQTTKESTIGKIDRLVVTKDFYFILDNISDAIYLFDRKGKYVKKIVMPGAFPTTNKEYLGISDFTVDENHKRIYLSHKNYIRNIFVFDFSGNFLKKIGEEIPMGFTFFSNKILLTRENPSNGGAYFVDTNVTRRKYLLPYIKHSFIMLSPYKSANVVDKGERIVFTRLFDNKIYEADTCGLIGHFEILFPAEYSLPANFSDSSFFNKQRNFLLTENRKAIYSINNPYKTGSYLFFTISNSEHGSYKNFMTNIVTNKTFGFSKISPDALNNYLPLFQNFTSNILASSSNSIFTAIPASGLIEYYDRHKDKIKGRVTEDVFKPIHKAKKGVLENPVLIEVVFKEEFLNEK